MNRTVFSLALLALIFAEAACQLTDDQILNPRRVIRREPLGIIDLAQFKKEVDKNKQIAVIAYKRDDCSQITDPVKRRECHNLIGPYKKIQTTISRYTQYNCRIHSYILLLKDGENIPDNIVQGGCQHQACFFLLYKNSGSTTVTVEANKNISGLKFSEVDNFLKSVATDFGQICALFPGRERTEEDADDSD